jgi:hypothetical protein
MPSSRGSHGRDDESLILQALEVFDDTSLSVSGQGG